MANPARSSVATVLKSDGVYRRRTAGDRSHYGGPRTMPTRRSRSHSVDLRVEGARERQQGGIGRPDVPMQNDGVEPNRG